VVEVALLPPDTGLFLNSPFTRLLGGLQSDAATEPSASCPLGLDESPFFHFDTSNRCGLPTMWGSVVVGWLKWGGCHAPSGMLTR